ncbi:MAG: hypothetical protein JNK82_38220 [Myxococcaceae bacterium]|nr:hypothetical protein [Myxococcaceae bacterium]
MKKLMAVAAGLLAAACGFSTMGDSNTLRFGQIVQYAEANDFSAPIAVGVTMPIGVQRTEKKALLNDYDYLESTLEVSGPAGVTPERKDTGKFEAVFPSAGTYTLKAKAGDLEDTLTVTAKPMKSLKLARLLVVTEAASKTCNAELTDLAGHTLKANQTLHLSVVPQDDAGKTMLGVLTLDTQDDGLTLTRPIGMANTFMVTAPSGSTGAASVVFTVHGTTHELRVQLQRDTTLATCPP